MIRNIKAIFLDIDGTISLQHAVIVAPGEAEDIGEHRHLVFIAGYSMPHEVFGSESSHNSKIPPFANVECGSLNEL